MDVHWSSGVSLLLFELRYRWKRTFWDFFVLKLTIKIYFKVKFNFRKLSNVLNIIFWFPYPFTVEPDGGHRVDVLVELQPVQGSRLPGPVQT